MNIACTKNVEKVIRLRIFSKNSIHLNYWWHKKLKHFLVNWVFIFWLKTCNWIWIGSESDNDIAPAKVRNVRINVAAAFISNKSSDWILHSTCESQAVIILMLMNTILSTFIKLLIIEINFTEIKTKWIYAVYVKIIGMTIIKNSFNRWCFLNFLCYEFLIIYS